MAAPTKTVAGHGTGALPEKPDERDFRAEEIAHAAPTEAVQWNPIKDETARVDLKENASGKIKRYGDLNDQDGAGACVGNTVAKVLGVENLREEGKFLELSPRSIYARGFVLPDGGMYPREGVLIGSKNGATLKNLLPSDGFNEEAMRKLDGETNTDRLIANIVRGGTAVSVPNDLNRVGAILERGKAIAMSIRFNGDLDPTRPNLDPNGEFGHEITLTTHGLRNKKKGVFYQNSWDEWGIGGCGWIPEEEFMKVETLWYYEDLPNIGVAPTTTRPEFTFRNVLRVGMDNADVAMLQRCLGYLTDTRGVLFPLSQSPTGYYGGITRDAVLRFQILKGIPGTGIVDNDTMAALNEEF